MGNTVIEHLVEMKSRVEKKIKQSIFNETPPSKEVKKEGSPSIKELRALVERKTLSSLLPYESFDDGIYYNKDTIGFMVIASPATGMGLTELKILNGIFSQVHRADACIQISIISDTNIEHLIDGWAYRKQNAVDEHNHEMFQLLTNNRKEYLIKGKWASLFSDRPFLLRNYYLVISYTIPRPEEVMSDEQEELKRIKASFVGTLKSSKIEAETLNPDFFINIMNGVLNPRQGIQPLLSYDPHELLSKQMVDKDTLALFDSGVSSLIHQGEAYSVIPYHVRHFPQRWAGYQNSDLIGSYFKNILRIPCPFIITLTVNIPDQLSAKGMVKRKFTRATQMADSPMAKYATQWRDRKIDWEYTANKVDSGDKLLLSFYQILLIAPEGKEQECEQAILSLYGSLGWVLSRSRYTPMHAFLGAMPMGLCMEGHKALKIFGHYQTRLSWNCTNVAPWIGEWKGTKNPLMLFMGRRGQITYFNPFDNNKGNYNIACCATSGSGKSFVTQELVVNALGEGGRAFVIDCGHSYRNICHLLRGTYIDFGVGNPNLNPFSKIFDPQNLTKIEELSKYDPDYGLKEYIADFMPMLIDLLAAMASPTNPLDDKSQSLLGQAITHAIEEYREDTTISHVAAKCLELKDNEVVIPEAKDLAIMLYPYTKDGMFGRYFEGKCNLDLNNSFVVLELDGLSDKGNLRSVALFILMIQINQIMYLTGNKKQIKQVIIDEAWQLLGKGRAGEFIEKGYRVARKYGGSYMTITQKISDYSNSEVAKAAYANADFKIYLRQDESEFAGLDNSDGKVEILKSLETIQGKYSELAIKSPDGMAIVRFLVDPVTEKIFSTKAEESEFLRKEQERGVNLFDAINELLKRSEKR
ncbi:MAG: type IV secretion system protein TraC [Oligoflexia bacterium]|nr:type IV secretion system protein TraC [Oligoflexia bacterium]